MSTPTETLREIERLYAELLEQSMRGGNDGRLIAAAPIPGGQAVVALSPWSFGLDDGSHRLMYDQQGAPREHFDASRVDRYRDEHWADYRREIHPTATLATWSLAWRDWFGHTDTQLAVTVRSASTYLRLNLEHMQAQGDDGAPDLDEMTRDLHAVKTQLENIVYDGQREERSEVPCLDCPRTRLVKRYHPKQTARDHWLCTRCKRKYDPDAYARAKHQHLVSEGAERFVLLQDAVEATRLPKYLIRGWMRRGKVLWCHSRAHHAYVWWPHIRECEREQIIAAARRKAVLVRRERKRLADEAKKRGEDDVA